jgi:SAM-dependent methyltransferase
LLPGPLLGRVLDIGTGTGRLLELLAPRIRSGLGIDASRAMLALARSRLAKPGLGHVSVRQADMYRLALPGTYDVVVLQMVLHYAEDPAAAILEAARMVAPGGQLIIVDLAGHDRLALAERLAHRWPGFTDDKMAALLEAAGLSSGLAATVSGPLDVRLWPARHLVAGNTLPTLTHCVPTSPELTTEDAR